MNTKQKTNTTGTRSLSLNTPRQSEINALIQAVNSGQYAMVENLALAMTRSYPQVAFAWKALGVALGQQEKTTEALGAMLEAAHLGPNDAEVQFNLGTILKKMGRLEEAESALDQAIVLQPNHVLAHNNLGNVLKDVGRLEEAETMLRQAIKLKPDYAEARSNLGVVLKDVGRLKEAETMLRQAIKLKPDYAEARSNLGVVLKDIGQLEEAETMLRQAIKLKPDYAEARNNLGVALKDIGRLEEAEIMLRQAIKLKPDYAEARSNLGVVLKDIGRLEEAETMLRQAIKLKPDYAEALSNLGVVLQDLGRLDESLASYQRAIKLNPGYTDAYSNLLFVSNYTADGAPLTHKNDAKCYGALVSKQRSKRYTEWHLSRSPTKLRLGFVSGDFRNHPVGFFLEGLLASIDKEKFEIFAYSTQGTKDELTSRIKPFFAEWHEVFTETDETTANLIHADAPHILIDLSGHTAKNRLPVFAYKPAPIQATWLGYFATTGVEEIDYWLGDPYVIPENEEHHFTERIWRLPETYLCFTPPTDRVEIVPLPALTNGHITFGCFNNITKMNDAVIALWANILNAVPNARLLLKTRHLDDKLVFEQTFNRFAIHGISRDRLILEGRSPRAELLASYNRVDIALDPFPYPGGTTTVEALWMGVPVLTKCGDRFLSHLGESIAQNTSQSDWIAFDAEDYTRKAVKFSSDLDLLAKLRTGLRAQILASPLFDAPRFARHFEEAMWGMWNELTSKREGTQ